MRATATSAGLACALACALGAGLVSACGDRVRAVAEPRQAPRPAAYLTVSDGAPAAGATVRLTAHTTPSVDPASFTARLLFDPAVVADVREDTLADGATRAVHVGDGVVRVAGVAPRGLAGRPLFALRVRARDAAAVTSVRLELTEVHDARRTDLRATVRTLPGAVPATAAPR